MLSEAACSWAASSCCFRVTEPGRSPGADGLRGVRSTVSRLLRRGLICGLVYPSARGSIAVCRVALATPDDGHGRAETLIRAPERRKVGSSILPLTAGSDLRKRALSDHASAIRDDCGLIFGPAIASGRSPFPRIAPAHRLVRLVQPATDQRWFSVTGGEHSPSREAL
jgi:hypothetical protein